MATVGAKDVYLRTPWPELYEDIPGLNFVNPHTVYRTQQKNVTRIQPGFWKEIPKIANRRNIVTFSYGAEDYRNGQTIIKTFEQAWKLNSFQFDLPDFREHISPHTLELAKGKPLAVIRPATVRSEWHVTSRNARSDYLAYCAHDLINRGYFVVSVADLKENSEWLIEPAPKCGVSYYRGELNIKMLMALIQTAKVVVGGVGWVVPSSIAAKTPFFCILGGRGAYDNPTNITDDRMDLSKVNFVYPDKFCMCDLNRHECNKTISNLPQKFDEFMSKL